MTEPSNEQREQFTSSSVPPKPLMRFFPNEPLDANLAQNRVWEVVRTAFSSEEGASFYRFPVYRPDGFLCWEIDILILLKRFGMLLIECKGCRIEQITNIQGHNWQMDKWYREREAPVEQVLSQMFALRRWLEPLGPVGEKFRSLHRVALPFISKEAWCARGFDQLPTTQSVALSEDLAPDALRSWVLEATEAFEQKPLTSEQWAQVLSRFIGPDLLQSYSASLAPQETEKESPPSIHESNPEPPPLVGQGGSMTSTTNPMTLVWYEGTPPTAEWLRQEIPSLSEDREFTYVVATSSQEYRRGHREQFAPSHQLLKTDESEEPQLLFHRAVRHWMRTSLLRRFEEIVLLRQAMGELAQDEDRRHQLFHDVFAWRDALVRLDEEGIQLETPLPQELLDRLVHPDLGALMLDLQQEFRKKIQAQQPARANFEAAARAYLCTSYRPTKTVVMEGFSRMTPLQRLFLDRCLAWGADVFVLSPYRKTQEYGFEVIKSLYSPIEPKKGKEYESENAANPGALRHLQENLFADNASSVTASDDSVLIESYTHRHREVEACVRRVVKLLDQGAKPSEIVVVSHDSAGYQPLLLEEATLQGHPELFNIPPRLLLLTPVGRFALSLYNIWQDDQLYIDADAFETFLASGLLGAEAQRSTDQFRLLKAQIFARCRSEAEWENAFELLSALRQELQHFPRLAPQNIQAPTTIELWRRLLQRLRAMCERLFSSGDQSIGGHINKLLDELEQLDDWSMRAAERSVLQGIRGALEDLSSSHSIHLTTQEFGEILNGMVRERSDEEQELRQDRIPVAGPESLDGHSVSYAFYLGLNNRHVPRSYSEPWPFEDRTLEHHLAQERYLFLAVIRAVRRGLFASFPLVEEAESCRPSIFVEEAAQLLGREEALNAAADLLTAAPLSINEEPSQPKALGRARRKEYQLAEIAHFGLCPYRYKIERVDATAQCYSTHWQLLFAAEGFYLTHIAEHLTETSRGIAFQGHEQVLNWLREAERRAEVQTKRAFPGLRPLDWVSVRQYIRDQMDNFFRHSSQLDSGRRYAVNVGRLSRPLEIDLIDGERLIKVLCDIRYFFQRGLFRYPYIQPSLLDEWLRYGLRPPEEGDEGLFSEEDVSHVAESENGATNSEISRDAHGIDCFLYQYNAVSWWARANRTAFHFHDENPNSNSSFIRDSEQRYRDLCEDLIPRIHQIELGIYPKNPGEHCKFCSLHGDCLGLEP